MPSITRTTVLAGILAFQAATSFAADGRVFSNIGFSHDGKRLILDVCEKSKRCFIHTYDLESRALGFFRSPDDEVWAEAAFSRDGKRIAFARTPVKEGHQDLGDRQVAVMDSSGRNLTTITRGPGVRIFPSFAYSGAKVIYARAEEVRTKGKTPAAGFDAFEVDINGGVERRLTSFRFFEMGRPLYLADDRRFIFSAEYPTRTVTDGSPEANARWTKDYESRYRKNWIFALEPGQGDLRPFLVFGEMSSKPLLGSSAGKLFFYGFKGGRDGSDYFLQSEDGTIRRVTQFPKSAVWSTAVSPDGARLAMIYSPETTGWNYDSKYRRLAIFDVESGRASEIDLPDRANLIN